jgi:haloalkane dehalogenase
MHRRDFIAATAGAIVGGTLSSGVRGASSLVAVDPPQLHAAAFHTSRRFASTVYGRIAYVERGRGPAALFVHGYPLNGFQWRGRSIDYSHTAGASRRI